MRSPGGSAGTTPSLELIAAPGNPGIAELGECVPIAATDVDGLVAPGARPRAVDLTVVGPEAPARRRHRRPLPRREALPIFGPTRAAAEIETSKAFAKQLMLEAGIPTARAEMHTHAADAKAAARAVRRAGRGQGVRARRGQGRHRLPDARRRRRRDRRHARGQPLRRRRRRGARSRSSWRARSSRSSPSPTAPAS